MPIWKSPDHMCRYFFSDGCLNEVRTYGEPPEQHEYMDRVWQKRAAGRGTAIGLPVTEYDEVGPAAEKWQPPADLAPRNPSRSGGCDWFNAARALVAEVGVAAVRGALDEGWDLRELSLVCERGFDFGDVVTWEAWQGRLLAYLDQDEKAAEWAAAGLTPEDYENDMQQELFDVDEAVAARDCPGALDAHALYYMRPTDYQRLTKLGFEDEQILDAWLFEQEGFDAEETKEVVPVVVEVEVAVPRSMPAGW